MAENPESPCHRSYFYVGGQYVDDGKGQHVYAGQMYVERLRPYGPIKHPWPIVFVHGGWQSGTNFLNTPDGRKGWASWLLDQGYSVYIIDQPYRARSSYHSSAGPISNCPAEVVEERWTACSHSNLWPEAALHSQWPGSGLMGDPVFDAYCATLVTGLVDFAKEQSIMQSVGKSLLDRIGPAILITHSQGGCHGWLWADSRPDLVKAIVAVEPSGPPFQTAMSKGSRSKRYGLTDIPLAYDPAPPPAESGEPPLQRQQHQHAASEQVCILQQEPARKLTNILRIPVLVVTAEASSHASYDEFTVRFLRQAGVKAEHLKLADQGIHGNGHLSFMEMNNLEIFPVLDKWITKIA